MATTNTKLREYIKANPGCTSAAACAAVGVNQNAMTGKLKRMLDVGMLRREIVGHQPTGKPIYGYHFLSHRATVPVGASLAEEAAPPAKPYVPKPKQIEASSPSIDHLVSALADTLVNSLIAQVQSRLTARLSELIPALPAPPSAEDNGFAFKDSAPRVIHQPEFIMATQPPPAPSLPRVAVVGLLPQQAGIIHQEFRDCYDLTFPEKDVPNQLHRAARDCEVAFMMCKFVSHATDTILKDGSAELIRVPGGMSDLRERMTNWKGTK